MNFDEINETFRFFQTLGEQKMNEESTFLPNIEILIEKALKIQLSKNDTQINSSQHNFKSNKVAPMP